MKKRTFAGGAHPSDFKNLTMNASIKKMKIPKRVRMHLGQHIGKPAIPIVRVGDKVKTGQKIAKQDGFVSCNIHSSVCGVVSKIDTFHNSAGLFSKAIEITSDEKDEWVSLIDDSNYLDLSKKKIISRIEYAGVCGMGGAGFPCHVKLSAKNVDTVILNGVECEPYITSDYRLMLEKPQEIIFGLEIFMKALGAKNGIIGIEDNKPKAIKALEFFLIGRKDISLQVLELKYPQGAEKQLIYACTKRKVPNNGGLPSHVGVVVQNVATAFAAYQAVRYRKPLIERIITVTGTAVRNPKNISARVGTSFEDLLEEVRGTIAPVKKVLSGGPMMGFALSTLKVDMCKTSSALIFLRKNEISLKKESVCINCGRCVDVCPLNLLPSRIALNARHKLFNASKSVGAIDCMRCGSCSYVCPANINIVQWIDLAKLELAKLNSAHFKGK